ncbi:sigma-70 family RNA polymerase sigma factor [Kitasatospora sp. NA04385]|uniref:RNA polymerase sigma factor n=1 Tax=Kitasatospora sp. NA04385 TaxID=2742135 RepID=UPI0015919018|nr:sigma-70 family RNA polymerase sigma factor [Kitasatospora sp. NA04385]QKW17672.1 sigma-70 family RNA polymerase sigma factor [Kitasatospora sp. NA04385]QKW23973.1 sigma-70 family RNA polymerase sigma factor [Kitasatospora sp. NA04385]
MDLSMSIKVNENRRSGAADDLVCRLLPAIRRQAARYARPPDVDDIVQSVCEKLLHRRPQLLKHPNPRAYALRAVITTAHDNRRTHEICLPDLTDQAGSTACATALREAQWETLRLLSQLSTGQARALILVDLDGRTIDEAATLLGVHQGTISRLRARGLRRSRDFLTQAQPA